MQPGQASAVRLAALENPNAPLDAVAKYGLEKASAVEDRLRVYGDLAAAAAATRNPQWWMFLLEQRDLGAMAVDQDIGHLTAAYLVLMASVWRQVNTINDTFRAFLLERIVAAAKIDPALLGELVPRYVGNNRSTEAEFSMVRISDMMDGMFAQDRHGQDAIDRLRWCAETYTEATRQFSSNSARLLVDVGTGKKRQKKIAFYLPALDNVATLWFGLTPTRPPASSTTILIF